MELILVKLRFTYGIDSCQKNRSRDKTSNPVYLDFVVRPEVSDIRHMMIGPCSQFEQLTKVKKQIKLPFTSIFLTISQKANMSDETVSMSSMESLDNEVYSSPAPTKVMAARTSDAVPSSANTNDKKRLFWAKAGIAAAVIAAAAVAGVMFLGGRGGGDSVSASASSSLEDDTNGVATAGGESQDGAFEATGGGTRGGGSGGKKDEPRGSGSRSGNGRSGNGGMPLVGYEESYIEQARTPEWSDWLFLRDYWFARIEESTCPEIGSEALKTHWDYDYDQFIADGMTEEQALSQDCNLFQRERNPRSMGPRLVRHMFHDAAGGFDGFVNVDNHEDNGGLEATQQVIVEAYNTVVLPGTDDDEDPSIPVNQVISLADFSAWAGQAALERAAQAVAGSAYSVDCTDPANTNEDCDIIPQIPVRWGRLSFLEENRGNRVPRERFPRGGPAGSGGSVVRFFRDEFDFSERETVTLMGVHTFGGAQKSASGYVGSFTQTKTKFNNDYQKQLIFPLPSVCPAETVELDDTCEFFSLAGDNNSDFDGMQTCGVDHDGRCEGWEQMQVDALNPDEDPKFQWQHSCRADGTGCSNHLMLNVDIGLVKRLDGFLCSRDDERAGVIGTLNRPCVHGMVKDYPPESACIKESSRVLASCFEDNETRVAFIEEDANAFEDWIHDFAPLFDSILTHRLHGSANLMEVVEPTP